MADPQGSTVMVHSLGLQQRGSCSQLSCHTAFIGDMLQCPILHLWHNEHDVTDVLCLEAHAMRHAGGGFSLGTKSIGSGAVTCPQGKR